MYGKQNALRPRLRCKFAKLIIFFYSAKNENVFLRLVFAFYV